MNSQCRNVTRYKRPRKLSSGFTKNALVLALALTAPFCSIANEMLSTKSLEDSTSDLITWIRTTCGGEFNSKLHIRRADPTDQTSIFGMFAEEDIPAEEILLMVPPKCVISAGGEVERGDAMTCPTIRNLIREMELKEDSFFAPYVNYLLSQKIGELPSAWSDAGQELLLSLQGNDLPPEDPVGWITNEWYPTCGEKSNKFNEFVALLAVQRGWDDIMVPVFDMMSHRNGKWLNTKHDSVLFGQEVRVFAARDIKAGEQIYTTYNFCTDCGGREDDYGTPEILRDHGFVEQYPQRWILFDGRVAFELDEDATTKSLQLTWFQDGSEPDDAGLSQYKAGEIGFIQGKIIETNHSIFATDDEPSPDEFKLVVQYHTTLTTAITKALESVGQVFAFLFNSLRIQTESAAHL